MRKDMMTTMTSEQFDTMMLPDKVKGYARFVCPVSQWYSCGECTEAFTNDNGETPKCRYLEAAKKAVAEGQNRREFYQRYAK